MKEELDPEREYLIMEVSADEITTFYDYLTSYVRDQHTRLAEEESDGAMLVQMIVDKLAKACHYIWYLNNYIRDIETPEEKRIHPKPGGYTLEVPFEDAELVAKVILEYDTLGKLTSWAQYEQIRYFYENFKAAKGR